MTARLTICLATRGRAHLLAETVERALANVRCPTTTLMLAVDDDDAETASLARSFLAHCHVSVAPREDTLGAKFNRCLSLAPADVYLTMVDYAPVLTPGFDEQILDAAGLFPDGVGAVYGPLANLSFPCLQAVTAGLVDRMGWLWPPYFPFWFGDHWIDDIARMIDRIAYVDVRVDFSSRRPGKTTGLREPGFWATLYDACRVERHRQAHLIIDAPEFQEPAWRKAMLRRNFHLIDQRSAMVNGNVRALGAQMEQSRGDAGAPDERYARVKAAGLVRLSWLVQQLQLEQQAAAA